MVSREKKRKSCPKRVNRQWRCTFRSVEGMCIKKGNTVPLRQEQCIRSHRRNCLFPKPGLLQHFGAGAVQPRYGEDSIGRSRCLAPAELPCRRAQSRGAPGKRPMPLANMEEPLLHVTPHGLAGLARSTGRSCGSGLVLTCGSRVLCSRHSTVARKQRCTMERLLMIAPGRRSAARSSTRCTTGSSVAVFCTMRLRP